MKHEPLPFFGSEGACTIGGGVRCTCGVAFTIGDSFPDTPSGQPSAKKLTTMKRCWEAYRQHWSRRDAELPLS